MQANFEITSSEMTSFNNTVQFLYEIIGDPILVGGDIVKISFAWNCRTRLGITGMPHGQLAPQPSARR